MKKLICSALALLVFLTLAGCKNENQSANNISSSDTSNSSSETAGSSQIYNGTESVKFDGKHFTAGVWETAFEGTVTGVYHFNESGNDCKYYVFSEEASIPFDYLINDDGGYIFHLGTPDFDTGATVVFTDSAHASLTWETSETEALTYVGNITIEEYLNKSGN